MAEAAQMAVALHNLGRYRGSSTDINICYDGTFANDPLFRCAEPGLILAGRGTPPQNQPTRPESILVSTFPPAPQVVRAQHGVWNQSPHRLGRSFAPALNDGAARISGIARIRGLVCAGRSHGFTQLGGHERWNDAWCLGRWCLVGRRILFTEPGSGRAL